LSEDDDGVASVGRVVDAGAISVEVDCAVAGTVSPVGPAEVVIAAATIVDEATVVDEAELVEVGTTVVILSLLSA
jgi:hypothetical protein